MEGLKRVELIDDPQGKLAGYLIDARLLLAANEHCFGSRTPGTSTSIWSSGEYSPIGLGRFERLQIELWLAEGKVTRAVAWADDILKSAASAKEDGREERRLAAARALIAKGDAPSLEGTAGPIEAAAPGGGGGRPDRHPDRGAGAASARPLAARRACERDDRPGAIPAAGRA